MNFRILFGKQDYNLSQDFANYYDLVDQIKTIPNVPDLCTLTYIDNQKNKMTINGQQDLEAIYYTGEKCVTLEIKDLSDDIFNMGLEEKEEDMQVEGEVEAGEKGFTEEEQDVMVCSNCKNGLQEVRYKCQECPQVDYCKGCYNFLEHQHPLVKIELASYGNMNGMHSPNLMVQGLPLQFTQGTMNKTNQEVLVENASCIEALFGCTYDQAYEFVSQHPGLNQDQLIELAMEMKRESQSK